MKYRILVVVLSLSFSVKNYAQFSERYIQCDTSLISSLNKYYDLIAISEDSDLYKKIFFESFPNNFTQLLSITDWQCTESWRGDHIGRFFTTKEVVGCALFYKKVINIGSRLD